MNPHSKKQLEISTQKELSKIKETIEVIPYKFLDTKITQKSIILTTEVTWKDRQLRVYWTSRIQKRCAFRVL